MAKDFNDFVSFLNSDECSRESEAMLGEIADKEGFDGVLAEAAALASAVAIFYLRKYHQWSNDQ